LRTQCEHRALHLGFAAVAMVLLLGWGAEGVFAESLYVDDDAPADPGPHVVSISDPQEDGSPEHPFDAIQEAVDAARDGDTVVVLDGEYRGEGNRDINFHGKPIVVRSLNGPRQCVIQCDGTETAPHRGFDFCSGEDARSVVQGFTITGGVAEAGGAIRCVRSSPVIRGNILAGNRSRYGGAIYCDGSSAEIVNNVIHDCLAELAGGGIAAVNGPVRIVNNTLAGNRVSPGGTGPARAHNLKVVSDSVLDVSTLEAAMDGIIEPGMTTEEKLLAIWRFAVAFRHQDNPPCEFLIPVGYLSDVMKIVNAYGYTFCGPAACIIIQMARRIPGVEARSVSLNGHVVSEVYFDGAWHMLDAAMICYFRKEDGSIASAAEIIDAVQAWWDAHPERVGETYPVRTLPRDQWPPLFASSEFIDADGYLPAGEHAIDGRDSLFEWYSGDRYITDWEPPIPYGYRCLMTLRQGERIVRRWSNDGRWVNMNDGKPPPYCLIYPDDVLDYASNYGDLNEERVGSGSLVYEPDLSDPAYVDGPDQLTNLVPAGKGDSAGLCLVDVSQTGVLVVRMQCPYPFLSMNITGRSGGGVITVSYALSNSREYTTLGTITEPGEFSLDPGPSVIRRYSCTIRFELSGADACLQALRIAADFQCSQRALPNLVSGRNTITVDGGPKVSTTTLEAGWFRATDVGNPVYTDYHPEVENLDILVDAKPALKNVPGTLTFPVSCPGDIVRLRFGGQVQAYNALDRVRYLVSCDGGQTWATALDLWGPHKLYTAYVDFDDIPPGTREVLVRYELNEYQSTRLFHFRIDADYDDGPDEPLPFTVTYTWSEQGEQRRHEQFIQSLPAAYTIDVESEPKMESVTLAAADTASAGALYCAGSDARVVISNCIIQGDQDGTDNIALRHSASASVSYSNLNPSKISTDPTSALTWGPGNTHADPLFADTAADDYHLLSQGGRWDPDAMQWVTDLASSPCIDAGDPDAPYGLEPFPNYGRINQGAYGNTPEASKSLWPIPADVNADCTVNVLDLIRVRNSLRAAPTGGALPCDVNRDGKIDVLDLIAVRNRLTSACE